MNATHPIARFVQGFFHDYLAAQRGLSPNTILSYRDSLKLFLRFVSQRVGKPVDKLSVEDFDQKLTVAFLDDLEASRGNSTQTRNNRLAALRAFFRYVAGQEPMVLARCQQICKIPTKRTQHKTIEWLEDNEMSAVLESVDHNSRNGLRDYALLMLLYNTGARAQEMVDLKIGDVRLQTPLQVKLTGKGNKERLCPLWPETVEALENYLNHREVDAGEVSSLFLNANGKPITRFGIRYIVRRYGAKAAQICPSLKNKKVNPHCIRHTTALHLIQSGNDIAVIKDWLGHADVNTTHGYVEIDMKMKRKALEACQPPKLKTAAKHRPKWLKPGILQWLDELSKTSGNYVQCSTGADSSRAQPART
ncbi:site-specific integrase [Acidobacteria bacterium AH-259-O06]|nr:site-specific integrase [Acidobacteria bacterium AH-259-O06]